MEIDDTVTKSHLSYMEEFQKELIRVRASAERMIRIWDDSDECANIILYKIKEALLWSSQYKANLNSRIAKKDQVL